MVFLLLEILQFQFNFLVFSLFLEIFINYLLLNRLEVLKADRLRVQHPHRHILQDDVLYLDLAAKVEDWLLLGVLLLQQHELGGELPADALELGEDLGLLGLLAAAAERLIDREAALLVLKQLIDVLANCIRCQLFLRQICEAALALVLLHFIVPSLLTVQTCLGVVPLSIDGHSLQRLRFFALPTAARFLDGIRITAGCAVLFGLGLGLAVVQFL